MMIALITKAKNPSVMMVSGKPNKLKTGFTIKFKIPKTIANITAVENPSKCTPGKIFVKRKATMAVIKSRRIKFIMFDFFNVYRTYRAKGIPNNPKNHNNVFNP